MKNLLIILMLFLTVNCVGQKEDLVKYLDAYKTSEFEESQKIIHDYSFGRDAKYTMSEYSTINGLSFTTDIINIKGYKAIVNCKLQNEAGSFIEKRMMIVMYIDKAKKHWSVFGMREPADAKYEYQSLKERVESGKFYHDDNEREYDYRSLAWWSLMSGHIKAAKKYIDLAVASAKEDGNNSFSTEKIDIAIKRIM